MKKILSLLSLVLLLASITSNAQMPSNTLNNIIDDAREKHNIPEITASVIKTEEFFYGISGVSNNIKSDTEILKSKIHLGTISKTITSFVAIKMVEKGLITFDTKIASVLPELSGIGKSNSLTLKNLLTNTSGLGAYKKEKDFKKIPTFNGNRSEKMLEFAKLALDKKSNNENFSNAGYVIAALMLEKVAKVPYEELVRNVIEEDLKLSCFTGLPDKGQLQNFWGSWNDSSIQIAHFASNPSLGNEYMVAAQGISMDIVDYSKILQLNLNGLLGDSNYIDHTDYLKMHFESESYGYGWRNSDADGYKISYHDFQSESYFCHAVIAPRYKVAIIIMAQIKDISGAYGVYALRDELIEKYRN